MRRNRSPARRRRLDCRKVVGLFQLLSLGMAIAAVTGLLVFVMIQARDHILRH